MFFRSIDCDLDANLWSHRVASTGIAAKVFAGTVDEHVDAGADKVPHQTLAQVTLKAIGDNTQLSDTKLNAELF